MTDIKRFREPINVKLQEHGDGQWVRLADHIAALEAVKATVKPLEWVQGDEDPTYHFAQSSIQNYIINSFNDDGLVIRLLGTSQYGVWFNTIDEAKGAAQADYDRRILSACVPSPALEAKETEAK